MAVPVDAAAREWQETVPRRMQELLSGQYGEITVAMQYLFQGWNSHLPGKYRDTVFGIGLHQNRWPAACRELVDEGCEALPAPSGFPLAQEDRSVAYEYQDVSDGEPAGTGSWASGPSPDGKGDFSYRVGPQEHAVAPMPPPTTPDPRLYGTTATPDLVEKVKGVVKDALRSCHRATVQLRRRGYSSVTTTHQEDE